METPFVRAAPARDPLIGRVLHDRYQVQKRIGKGGMGIVYLAEHVLLRRKVALKTLSDRAFADEELVARFHREAMAAVAVGNPHIVDVTDMGQLEDGTYFIVLEYLEGAELGYALATEGPFPLGRAVHVVGQLCDALIAVHAAGIVHRDLKPENLFLIEREGVRDFVKVLDFGVCKVFEDEARGGRVLTRTGDSLGTPQFMAPEQIEGSAGVDERADVYAAGAILYFALTGEAPFDGASLQQLFLRVSNEPPPSLRARRPELPPALEALITRALQKRPEDRYQSAAELRAALEPFADPSTNIAPVGRASADSAGAMSGTAPALRGGASSAYDVLPRRSRRLTRGMAAAGFVLACVVLAFFAAMSSRSSPAAGVRRAPPPRPTSSAAALNRAPQSAATTSGPPLPATAGASEGAPAAQVEPEGRAPRARARHQDQPASPAAVQAEPAAAELERVAPPAAEPARKDTHPAPRSKGYGLSQRGLKDVFE